MELYTHTVPEAAAQKILLTNKLDAIMLTIVMRDSHKTKVTMSR